MTAARDIARTGCTVFLVEKEKKLGGMMSQIHRTITNREPVSKYLIPIIEEVASHPKIQVFLNSRVEPKHIAIIHCVGSRNPDILPYCSRNCCHTALKYANQIMDLLPQAHVYQIYTDMRAMGKGCEELYSSTGKRGVLFLMYDQKGKHPYIREAGKKDGTRMIIEMKELLSGENVKVPADLVILMVGVEAHEPSKQLSQVLGISMCSNKFYMEKHPKLIPLQPQQMEFLSSEAVRLRKKLVIQYHRPKLRWQECWR